MGLTSRPTGAICTAVFVVLASGSCRSSGADDWCYEPPRDEMDGSQMNAAGASSGAPSGDMGFAAGGAMDINNFRQNVENGYLPLVTDIPYEGLFYDYFFDTDQAAACSELFCPSYTEMLSTDPTSGEPEMYLSVGLNSGMRESDFSRKRLNLVVVLDISGSMGSSFTQYYYDGDAPGDDRSKMEIANESVVALLGHLAPEDSFGMVLFESEAHLAKPLRPVGDTDMDAIAGHILEIGETGGTNMEAGYLRGTALFDAVRSHDADEVENRIIFLTDAMPNTGELGEESLLGMVDANAEAGIYTTFIGIGLDFNTTLINAITRVRGANYHSVHSAEEFATQMDDDFDLMVTPLVFNLQLALDSEGISIGDVYGSPEADLATGTLLFVNTLFPSRVVQGETRGGLILVRLEGEDADPIELAASYENRSGEESTTSDSFTFDAEVDAAPSTGIRKGILLTRYARIMREWITFERDALGLENPTTEEDLGQWERESTELVVSPEPRAQIEAFLPHFRSEAEALGDETLDREIELMETLLAL